MYCNCTGTKYVARGKTAVRTSMVQYRYHYLYERGCAGTRTRLVYAECRSEKMVRSLASVTCNDFGTKSTKFFGRCLAVGRGDGDV